ncbi:polymorphic toxin-type HINT domain-containing protein [Streptomyces sp. NPDC051992]|uniref:polymorphic toxin-type HINT domain-containing protein n=1 Tax=Streptomyces sp. NPDC051992 TaxID=3161012 RepID=UPI0034361A84
MTEPSDFRGRRQDEPPTPPPPPAYPPMPVPMPAPPPGPGAPWWRRLTDRQRLLLFGGVGVLVLALVAGTLLTVSGTVGSDDGKAVAKRNLQPFRQAVEELGAAQGLTYQDTSAFGVTENRITATAGGSKYGTTSSGGKRLEQGLLNVDGKTFMRWSQDPAPPPGAESGKPGKWMADHEDKDSLAQEALRRTLPPPQLAEVLTQALDALEKAPPAAERPDEKPRSVHGKPALAIDTSAGRLLVTRQKPHQVLRLEPYDFHEFTERLKEGEAPETIPEVTRGPLTVGSPEGMDIMPVLGDAVDAMFDTLLDHTKQLKNAGDRGIDFTIDGSGDMNCSSSGCSVTQKFTGEVTSKARDERVSKGQVSAVLTATFSIGGQSAGKCTSPRSTFRLTGNNAAGTLRCSNPGAGSVYSSVAARYKARAEAQSRASGGRVVHYSIPLRANTLVEASALAAVEVKALVDRVNGERGVADCAKPHSFPSGTQVLLADGAHRPIEDIRTGDRVTATDPDRGLTTARPVTDTITTDDDKDFTRLTLTTAQGPATLTATDNHPFWLTNAGRWADAADIRIGDELRSPTGAPLRVAGVLDQRGPRRTYDLTVGGLHTYYVLAGTTPVLVHNCNNLAADAAKFPGLAHTLDEHVNVSRQQAAALAARKNAPNGVFHDAQTAQQVVDYGLAGNAQRIKNWLRGAERQLTIRGSFGANNSIGWAAHPDGRITSTGNQYTMVLQRQRGHQSGYFVLTAYPR